MKKYLLLLLLNPFLLLAKNNGDSLKFEIIKAASDFYKTEGANTNGLANEQVVCTYSSSSDAAFKCLLENWKKESKVRTNINKWREMPSASSSDLQALTDSILSALSTSRGKKVIKNLKTNIKDLAVFFSESKPGNTENISSDDNEEKTKSEVPEFQGTKSPADDTKSKSMLPLLGFILSIVALVLASLAFAISKGTLAKDNKQSPDYHELKVDVKDLKSKLAQKQPVDLTPLQNSIRSIENRISNLENQTRPVQLHVEKKAVEQFPSHSSVFDSQMLYAKLPDSGNVFSGSSLAKEQNGEQIYEIEVKGDKATYAVSGDANAQKYALTDFSYYLSSACDFLNQPVKGARIITLEKGRLSKSGGNWIIQNKAKIEFK